MADRDEIVIATKLWGPMRKGRNAMGLSRKAVMAEVDHSLRRLGTDYIDLYQIHRWDPHTPIEETLEALDDVIRAGKVRYIGASSMWAWQFAKALFLADQLGFTRFVSMQNHYNLVQREEEREMLPLCADQGIGVIPWSPLARGRLTRDWDDETERSRTDEFGRTLYDTSESDRAIADVVAVDRRRARHRPRPGRARLGAAQPGRDRADHRRHQVPPHRRRRRGARGRAHRRRGRPARSALHAPPGGRLRLTSWRRCRRSGRVDPPGRRLPRPVQNPEVPLMSDALVLRTDEAGVCTLTLNRPDKLNAFDPRCLRGAARPPRRHRRDDAVRCVVLAGAGRSFCAGHDLGSIAENERAPSKHFEPETVDALEALPQPTIARLHGHCFTGGLELALACDLLVAAESTTLGDTHGQWGLVPIWGMSVRLPERVGLATAKQLMFTSRRIAGTEAAAIGLVDRCVPDGELDDAVADLAAEISANSAGHQSHRQAPPGRPRRPHPHRGAAPRADAAPRHARRHRRTDGSGRPLTRRLRRATTTGQRRARVALSVDAGAHYRLARQPPCRWRPDVSTLPLPRTPDDVTAEWLTSVLHGSGALPEAGSVASFTRTPVAEGVGMLSAIEFIGLTYAR